MMPTRDVIVVGASAGGVEVGHAYGPRTLLVRQAEDFEAALQMALRASHGAGSERREATS
jgi:hypothetical protein